VLFSFAGKNLLFAGDAQWGNWEHFLYGGAYGTSGHTATTSEAKSISPAAIRCGPGTLPPIARRGCSSCRSWHPQDPCLSATVSSSSGGNTVHRPLELRTMRPYLREVSRQRQRSAWKQYRRSLGAGAAAATRLIDSTQFTWFGMGVLQPNC
jgi:hypothetical protein